MSDLVVCIIVVVPSSVEIVVEAFDEVIAGVGCPTTVELSSMDLELTFSDGTVFSVTSENRIYIQRHVKKDFDDMRESRLFPITCRFGSFFYKRILRSRSFYIAVLIVTGLFN